MCNASNHTNNLIFIKQFGGLNFKINLFLAKTVLQKLKVRFLRYKKCLILNKKVLMPAQANLQPLK